MGSEYGLDENHWVLGGGWQCGHVCNMGVGVSCNSPNYSVEVVGGLVATYSALERDVWCPGLPENPYYGRKSGKPVCLWTSLVHNGHSCSWHSASNVGLHSGLSLHLCAGLWKGSRL